MKCDVVNISGEKVREIELPESIYAVEMNEHVLHTVVKAYRANRRQGTHATKTRSMVAGGNKKPFKQKGTGNARQGSSIGPHQYGGAVAHGPQPRDYTQSVNRKVKNLAMRIALSDKARHNKLVVVESFGLDAYSTKKVAGVITGVNRGKRVLLSDERKDDLLYKSTRNIHGSSAVTPSEMNVEDILRHEAVFLSEDAVKSLQQRLQKGEK